jgi:hypothetical protein
LNFLAFHFKHKTVRTRSRKHRLTGRIAAFKLHRMTAIRKARVMRNVMMFAPPTNRFYASRIAGVMGLRHVGGIIQ